MTSAVIDTSFGPWRAAVLLGGSQCRFEPVDWLRDREPASQPQEASRSAVVELRRTGGGVMPWALLVAAYEPDTSGALEVHVAHSGGLVTAPAHDCIGLLGRPLATGLPKEFAEATLDGLIRFNRALNRSGHLVVDGGAYDEADSSQFAFEHCAALLKWALLGAASDDEVSVGSLEQFLRTIR
jgi:hypothetical protein